MRSWGAGIGISAVLFRRMCEHRVNWDCPKHLYVHHLWLRLDWLCDGLRDGLRQWLSHLHPTNHLTHDRLLHIGLNNLGHGHGHRQKAHSLTGSAHHNPRTEKTTKSVLE